MPEIVSAFGNDKDDDEIKELIITEQKKLEIKYDGLAVEVMAKTGKISEVV